MDRIFELKIELDRTKPLVWRQMIIPESFTLYELHHLIQIAFGWKNYHLYSFIANEQIIGNPVLMDDPETINDRMVDVSQVLKTKGDKICYEYDFGDGWMHTITLARIIKSDVYGKTPIVVNGAMACPPEDCGGIPGYENLKDVMKNPKHPEYKEFVQWLGKAFDPQLFNLQMVNKEMLKLKKYIKEYETED
ncbi:MAG TPA: plasmid pRiA4b ORF-3 family protein [Bacteroidia bacterium]|nr:plasmid pRiA4b ORF-3 family protein [Bacteroidia bacterium]HRH09260.1 plasmid pRiA4b ORF-3 family protein [Bacteroidia bacterium]